MLTAQANDISQDLSLDAPHIPIFRHLITVFYAFVIWVIRM